MKITKQLDCHGAYEIMCDCGHTDKKLMHGIIWCANCMRNRPAHDMLVEFNKSISLPDGCRPNSGQCPPPGGE